MPPLVLATPALAGTPARDARQAPTIYGRLLGFSRAEAVKRCCNAEVLGELAVGNICIAYNILGSYAYAAYLKNPN